MPVTRSASKKMRADVTKTVVNTRRKRILKDVVKKAQASATAETIRTAISQIDKAVKNHLLHRNKAAHMKSQLMRQTAPAAKTSVKVKRVGKKPVAKKAPAKKSSAKAKK